MEEKEPSRFSHNHSSTLVKDQQTTTKMMVGVVERMADVICCTCQWDNKCIWLGANGA